MALICVRGCSECTGCMECLEEVEPLFEEEYFEDDGLNYEE